MCILTCPTTAVFDAMDPSIVTEDKDKKTGEMKKAMLKTGTNLRYFGDGFEVKDSVGGREVWSVPRMEGNFFIEPEFGTTDGVAGGNMIFMAKDQVSAVEACEKAAEAGTAIDGVVATFPGRVCGSGSKTGSLKYSKFLHASTNHMLCPTLREKIDDSLVPEGVKSVTELVLNSLDKETMDKAMKAALQAAASLGKDRLVQITAANYGGSLGKFQFHLKDYI